MHNPKSIFLLLSFLVFACGGEDGGDTDVLNAENLTSPSSDDFVNTIATRITDLGGGTDLLSRYAEYEQVKRASEDQFFQKQLDRIVEYSPNSVIRDDEKSRVLVEFDSSKVVLCRSSDPDGYLGSEGSEESYGFCGSNSFVPMGEEDFVRYLSYTLAAEKATAPIRQITSVRLNRKIRLVFEESRPVYHVILGERQRGAFKLGGPELDSNGLEMGIGTLAAVPSSPTPSQITSTEEIDQEVKKEDVNVEPVVENVPPVQTSPVEEEDVLPNLDNLITSYLDLQEGQNIDAIMRLYDDRVRYNDKGTISQSSVRSDKLSYFKRWPNRNHQRISDVTVTKASSAGSYLAKFDYTYALTDGKSKASGKVWMELTVKESNGSYVITRERGGAL